MGDTCSEGCDVTFLLPFQVQASLVLAVLDRDMLAFLATAHAVKGLFFVAFTSSLILLRFTGSLCDTRKLLLCFFSSFLAALVLAARIRSFLSGPTNYQDALVTIDLTSLTIYSAFQVCLLFVISRLILPDKHLGVQPIHQDLCSDRGL
jgi:hypothetical protein